MANEEQRFPSPSDATEPPFYWHRNQFSNGLKNESILEYTRSESGWSHDLTQMHVETVADKHFIDIASRAFTIHLLKKYGRTNSSILEIGCSGGYMLRDIKEAFPDADIIGADAIPSILYDLRKIMHDVPLLQFDLCSCPLYDESVESVIMLNVLEHIEDDVLAIQQVYRILKPGGLLFIEVPAGPKLFDHYDKTMMHYRRYATDDLLSKAKQVGFMIKKSTHLAFLVYPGFWLTKKWNRLRQRNGMTNDQATAENQIKTTGNSKIMGLLMRFERWLSKWFDYPVGIRIVLVLNKPS